MIWIIWIYYDGAKVDLGKVLKMGRFRFRCLDGLKETRESGLVSTRTTRSIGIAVAADGKFRLFSVGLLR